MKRTVVFFILFMFIFCFESFAKGVFDKTINYNYTYKIENPPQPAPVDKPVIEPPDRKPVNNSPIDKPITEPSSPGERINVNSDFANFNDNREPITKAKYYLSKTFILRMEDKKDSNEVLLNDGMVVIKRKESKPNEIVFPNDREGVYQNSIGNSYFDILFKQDDQPNDQQPILRFTRIPQLDNFILASVKLNNEWRSFRSMDGEPIILQIYGKDERDHILSAGAKTTSVSSKPSVPEPPKPTTPKDNNKKVISRNIIADGSLNMDSVFRYIKSKNNNPVLSDAKIKELIQTYFTEAGLEKVNHDIAIAQMLYYTNFLKKENIKTTYNYGGIDKKGAKWNYKQWNGSFPNMKIGVRAHIQHLRYYSNPRLINTKFDNVDPRKHLFGKDQGKIHTLDQLFIKWTGSASYSEQYKRSINNILNELYAL